MKARRIPVTVVIVDSGPLISLAACERLDLLDCFDRKVRITDVVRAECLRFPEKVGAATLKLWFEEFGGDRYSLVATPLLDDWIDAVAQEDAGDETRPSRGIGDASITWLIQRIGASAPHDEVILLLSDDAPFGDVVVSRLHPEVYLLSTRLFLQVLENFDLIDSARDLMHRIVEAGRQAARYAIDRPGRLAPGVKSQWTDVLCKDDSEPKL